jgi:hypothetical protein
MANTYIMRWPSLNKQVRCDKIGHNQHIFDWWVDQLPLKAVHEETMVAGWCLYALVIPLKKHTTWKLGTEVREDLSKNPIGRVHMDPSAGEVLESSVKFGENTEYIPTISFAQVREEDLPILKEVGMIVWNRIIQTKEITPVEFVGTDKP